MINATLFWIEPIEKESASLLTAVKLKQKNAEELLCCTSVVEPIQAPVIYVGGSERSPSEEFWREPRWMHFCPSPCLQLSDLLSHIFLFLSLFNHFAFFQLQIQSRPDVMRRQLTFCPLALLGLAWEKSGTPGRLLGWLGSRPMDWEETAKYWLPARLWH